MPLLDQAVALEPDNLRAWGSRGLTLGNIKRYDEGLSDLDRLLAIEPNNRTGLYEAWDNQGYAYVLLGKYAEALVSIERSIVINPKHANGQYNKACCFAY